MRHVAIALAAAVAWTACAAVPARAETIDVSDNHGGVVPEYDAHWAELAARGVNVRIVGPCQSACTVLLGHIPNDRICVTPQASFGFHTARFPEFDRDPLGRLQSGHSRLDQRARRSHARLQMDACARHLSLLPQVLKEPSLRGART